MQYAFEIVASVGLFLAITSGVASVYAIREMLNLGRKILGFSTVQKLEYNPQVCTVCDRVVVKHVPLDSGGVICATCHDKKR